MRPVIRLLATILCPCKEVRRRVAALALTTVVSTASVPCLQAATVIAPNDLANVAGSAGTVRPFRGGNADVSFQWIFPASDFSSVPPGSSMTSIGLRLAGTLPAAPPGPVNFDQWNLQLSSTNNPSLTLSPTYADNIGADAVTVRSGPLTIPTNSFPGGPGPNDFYDIPFTTPYVYTGGELVVTLRHTAHSGAQDLIFNDGDSVDNGRGNSVGGGFADLSGSVAFFNFPVTRFTFVPEPSGMALAISTALPVVSRRRKYRRQTG